MFDVSQTMRPNPRSCPDISFFISSMGDGGAQRTVANLATELSKRGYDVDILLLRVEGPYLNDLHQDITIVDLKSSRAITSVYPLIKYLRRKQPKVLFSTLNYLNIVALIANTLSRTPTNHVIRSANIQSGTTHSGISRLTPILMRLLYPSADSHIALSHSVADQISEKFGINRGEITVVFNPVVTDELLHKAEEHVHHPWFDTDTPLILSAGRLSKQKDFATLIRAFKRVLHERDARLLILGKGEMRSELEALLNRLDLTDYVSMPGFVDNPFVYMQNADVFVLSSQWEGFGNVLVEAMACGTPVISTNCPGGPSEILVDGKYGPLVPVGDPDSMAEAILCVLDDRGEIEAIQDRAHDFSVTAVTDQYEKLLFPVEQD